VKIQEILTERMEIAWVRPWIDSAINNIDRYADDVDWYEQFFDNLNRSPELKAWKEKNIKNPLNLKPRIRSVPDHRYPLLDAEHSIETGSHEITIEVNSAYAPLDAKSQADFAKQLSDMLIHELNHAHQREQQLRQGDLYDIDTLVWRKPPPDAKNERERYFQYMIDHMEQDSWISQIASYIHSRLGKDSLSQLNKIFTDVKKDQYVIIHKQILDLSHLKILYNGFQHYQDYLKHTVEDNWNQVKKRLYSYLKQYDK